MILKMLTISLNRTGYHHRHLAAFGDVTVFLRGASYEVAIVVIVIVLGAQTIHHPSASGSEKGRRRRRNNGTTIEEDQEQEYDHSGRRQRAVIAAQVNGYNVLSLHSLQERV
jgi:hypothetical protein